MCGEKLELSLSDDTKKVLILQYISDNHKPETVSLIQDSIQDGSVTTIGEIAELAMVNEAVNDALALMCNETLYHILDDPEL